MAVADAQATAATSVRAPDWDWQEPAVTPVRSPLPGGDAVDRLVAQAEFAASPAETVALLRRAARMAETPLRDRDRAFRVLGRAFRCDPGGAAVIADLERLADILARWDELLAL